jgi:hypothetical protein
MLIVLIVGLALTGCTLYDPPPKPMKLVSETPSQEWCGKALLLFGNPLLDVDTKQAVLEAMRNHECSASNLPQPKSS